MGELVSPTLLHTDDGDIIVQKETFYKLGDRRVFLLDDSDDVYRVIKAIKLPNEQKISWCS